jgi:hypothetical protein
MSYNPNIPVIGDSILQSQAQIKANFQAISAAFSDNHVGLTQDPTFSGMHDVLTLRPQGSDPTTSATQIALYNKLVSSVPELFFRPNNSQTPIQLNYPSIKADSSNTQYSFVAGPFIVYGGFISAPTNGQVVTLSPGITLLYVDLTAANSTISPTVPSMAVPTSITGNSFTIKYQNTGGIGSFDVYYFAIGV